MSAYEVNRISMGMVNAYLVKTEKQLFLIDTGLAGKQSIARIEAACGRMGRSVGDIDMILLTHTHHDHAGGAAECKSRSAAPILLHKDEAEVLRFGISGFPAGTNSLVRFMVAVAKKRQKGGTPFPPAEADIVIDSDLDLHNYGFPGVAVPTPSHTAGSLSLLTDWGDCFCGDILFNIFPGTVFPPVADNPEALTSKWSLLLERGAKLFYPGHGGPIERQRVERELQRRA
ncbi:MAG: MBL fold metallo-hydrolase [Spirochaetia bacterium]|nr:MBL fold metallo-hydrolase [Spirochaetia bacterium]